LLAATLGLGSGIAAKRLAAPMPASGQARVVAIPGKSAMPDPDLHAAVPSDAARSNDTLESLASLQGGELYPRLALWLVDAGEEDIAAYWQIYQKGKRSNEVTTLIFLSWTRLNPQAITFAAGSADEEFAWRAWACNDPQGALAAATVAGGERVKNVCNGLAQFHPAWLREHFDELPQDVRNSALSRFRKYGDTENPLEMLKFNREHGGFFDGSTLRALISKDPSAALEWAKGNSQAMQTLTSQMAEESPDELARLAARSPSGATKRTLEAALFANLIKADADAAFAEAKATVLPRAAAEKCAAVGLALVKSDPAKAFEMAEHLFATCPDAMMKRQLWEMPGSSGSSTLTAVPGVPDFMSALMFQDPAKAMDIVAAIPRDSSQDIHAFDELSDLCLQRDVTAYAEWVKGQGDPVIRRDGIKKVIVQLQKDGRYANAADWALSLPEINRLNDIQSMFNSWAGTNLTEARAWLDSVDLPAEEKRKIRSSFGP
jgi:hypothetical protein